MRGSPLLIHCASMGEKSNFESGQLPCLCYSLDIQSCVVLLILRCLHTFLFSLYSSDSLCELILLNI